MEPNQAEQLRGTLGAVFDDDSPPAGSQRVSESTPLAGMLSDMMLRDSVPASTSDPDYIAYYYANRTLNPRLPPPTVSQSINRPLQWAGGDANSSYGRADEVKPAEPALGSLLFSGLRESDLSHQSGLNSLRTASARKPSTWSGTTEAPGLDALLHAFSPAKGAGGAGTFFSNPSEEDSTAAYNEEALFGGGSSSHTPTRPSGSLMASPQPAMFDATVGSPGSSLRPTAANLISQDPKMVLRRKQELLQSKLRIASMANPSDPPNILDGSGSSSDAQASALNEALRSMSGMPTGITPEQQQHAAMVAGMQTPEGMADLLSGQPNHFQAMYMASMYPFFAQQQAMQFPFMGMPGMMPSGMGFPGMPAMMPGMMPTFPGMMPGAFPGMPGLPGMMGTPEMAAYYQKMMEVQASAMAAMGTGMSSAVQGGGGASDSIDLDGHKRRDHAGLEGHNMAAIDGSPARRRDLSGDMPQVRGRDSPARREAARREAVVSADGMGRKNIRRDDEKRSDPVLDEFKNNKAKKFEFPDIFGHVYEFSMDQHGSRFIQQKLETVGLDELSLAIDEVLPRILNMVTDVFGNYVVQKFLDHGQLEQRLKIFGMLQGNVLSMSLQMYGCRVVQKALEVLPLEIQCEIMGELDGQVMRCVRDQNGNHVIQKIIECIPTPRILHILDSFLTCVVALSSHPFGCRVIQRILEYCQDHQRRGVVMDEILKASCQLAQDQYGNYVIQHVLERGTAAERLQIVNNLAPRIVAMSMHKFASNVVEKCLIFCSIAERDILIQSMLALPSLSTEGGVGSGEGEEEDPLQQMMKDQFGNYVVQKVLELCDDAQREMMLSRVRLQLHALKKYTYGKHIVARVEKLLATGTKMQSSNKHISQPPLPDDSELPVLQQILAIQQQKKQTDVTISKPGSPNRDGQPTDV